jgi:hypothetical protein
MVYTGHIRNGMIVLDQPVVLPEGLEVSVNVPGQTPARSPAEEKLPTPSETLLKYSGKAVGLPEDAARNHDHYLYGTPKR